MKTLHTIVAALIIFGALNWGLVGLLNFNLVGAVLGYGLPGRIVFVAIGAAGALAVYTEFAVRRGEKPAEKALASAA